ncbi:MAG: hypothetical protein GF414_06125 [Candidatus Altiarchaeales archaeon]|nr:hypothetical protein [Candidatus Altiarchaeales archaeon]
MRERGYLFTALTFFMLISVFSLAYFYHGINADGRYFDVTPMKNRAINDNIGENLEETLGLDISVNRSGNVTVEFEDYIPSSYNVTYAVVNYSDYVNTKYKASVNSNITLDVTQFNLLFPIDPYSFTYGWENDFKRGILAYNTSSDTSTFIGYDIVATFADDRIYDVMWLEGENLTGGGDNTASGSASGGYYKSGIAEPDVLTRTVTSPLTTNYTLWVRSLDNQSTDHQFIVGVGGVNSSSNFGEHTAGGWAYGWEMGDNFTVTAGPLDVKVYGLASNTAAVDVIMLASDPDVDPNDYGGFGRPPDTLEAGADTGDLDFTFHIEFDNLKYSYAGDLNKSGESTFNFTFKDNDSVRFTIGKYVHDGLRTESYRARLNNSRSGSRGTVKTMMRFET